jgi:hypothetical protein
MDIQNLIDLIQSLAIGTLGIAILINSLKD